MIENVDTLLREVVRTLYTYDAVNIDRFAPARVAHYFGGPSALANIKVLLSQISLTLSVVFGATLLYVIIKRRALTVVSSESSDRQELAVPTTAPGALRGRWDEILGHLDSARENDWKLAVLEADKLADSALMRAGFPGDTFGDRLTNIPSGGLVSLDGLWWAHKVRNRVAHELDYFLRYTEARQAMSYYEAVLSELQLI